MFSVCIRMFCLIIFGLYIYTHIFFYKKLVYKKLPKIEKLTTGMYTDLSTGTKNEFLIKKYV